MKVHYLEVPTEASQTTWRRNGERVRCLPSEDGDLEVVSYTGAFEVALNPSFLRNVIDFHVRSEGCFLDSHKDREDRVDALRHCDAYTVVRVVGDHDIRNPFWFTAIRGDWTWSHRTGQLVRRRPELTLQKAAETALRLFETYPPHTRLFAGGSPCWTKVLPKADGSVEYVTVPLAHVLAAVARLEEAIPAFLRNNLSNYKTEISATQQASLPTWPPDMPNE